MYGHLAVVGHGVINKLGSSVAIEGIVALGVGLDTGVAVAHNNTGHGVAALIGNLAAGVILQLSYVAGSDNLHGALAEFLVT